MLQKLFISYSVPEAKLANQVANSINDAFGGSVQTFLSDKDLMHGKAWKDQLKVKLKEYDAILIVLTPRYLKRPWAYVEWAAFWMEDKDYYILLTDNIEVNDLISPMQDCQATRLFNPEEVMRLFTTIKQDANYKDRTPFEEAKVLSLTAQQIYKDLLAEEKSIGYSVYKDLHQLPNNDHLKKDVLNYYYFENGNAAHAAKIFERINDSSIKVDLLLTFLEKGELKFIEDNFRGVKSQVSLIPLLNAMLLNGMDKEPLFGKLIDYLGNDQPALKQFSIMAFDEDSTNDDLFKILARQFNSPTSARITIQHLISLNNRHSGFYTDLYNYISQHSNVEWRKTLISLIENKNTYDKDFIQKETIRLAKINQREAYKVLISLSQRDCPLLRHLVFDIKIITLPDLLEATQEYIKNNCDDAP